jgi:hypothetical protein
MPEQLIRLFEDSKAPGRCRGCEAAIDWFETLAGKKMPMNPDAVPRKSEKESGSFGRVVAFYAAEDSHWNTCPEREQFKRGRA